MRPLRASQRLLSVAALGAGPGQFARICLAGVLLGLGRRRSFSRPIRLRLEYGHTRFACVVSEVQDLHLLRHVFVTEQYRLELARQPDVIVDAGSNSGLSALYFRIVHPHALIVALEPDPVAFRRLEENTRGWPGFVLRNAALAARDERRVFYRSAHTWTSSFIPSESWLPTEDATPVDQIGIEVEARTLGSLIAELGTERVDLLKVDVEGAEWEILPSLAMDDRVGAIIGELHWDVHTAPQDRDVGALLPAHHVTVRDLTRQRSEFLAVRPAGRLPGTSPPPR